MTNDDGLRPAEQAILEQIETRLVMTRAAVDSIGEALDSIEPADLLSVMATPDDRQAALIGILSNYDAGLAGLVGLGMLLDVAARIVTAGGDTAEQPTSEEIDAMVDDLIGGVEGLLGNEPGEHRFTAGPDGEVEER